MRENRYWGLLSQATQTPGLSTQREALGGPGSSVSITRRPLRDADTQALPRTCWIRICMLTRSPGDLDALHSSRSLIWGVVGQTTPMGQILPTTYFCK